MARRGISGSHLRKELAVLGKSDSVPTVAVKDLGRAREFYEGTLGLEVAYTVADQVTAYVTGNTFLLVYVSEHAGTNEATAVTWGVGADVDGVVEQLKSKGVSFEHYDLPGTTREGDIHVMGDMRAAWFEDPDGNIHSLVTGSTPEWRAGPPS
jgi:catechol 2,3-dioxygenase-like lactoylglutathione lyase family enzyme